MDNKDKNFFIALAYVAAREDISDPTAFRQKVLDIQKEYDAERPAKANIPPKGKYGLYEFAWEIFLFHFSFPLCLQFLICQAVLIFSHLVHLLSVAL